MEGAGGEKAFLGWVSLNYLPSVSSCGEKKIFHLFLGFFLQVVSLFLFWTTPLHKRTLSLSPETIDFPIVPGF